MLISKEILLLLDLRETRVLDKAQGVDLTRSGVNLSVNKHLREVHNSAICQTPIFRVSPVLNSMRC